ncbi:TcaA NTF2-like domain-containing protein [Bacillus rhizoplanae]|uniref:TcaA NTF2-like domain-containing protein n=1 Tax=Bacillus rhizoplanae TaxID=2880966 RepID=UPI003D2095D2
MSRFKKLLYIVIPGIGALFLAPLAVNIVTPLVGDIVKGSPQVKSLTTPKKEETATNSYEIVQEQLKDFAGKYMRAHNEGDFSLVKQFYTEGTSPYVSTKNYIESSYKEQFKVDLFDITLKKEPQRIANSSTYNIKTDLEYRYDSKGKKTKEVVTDRIYQVTLTSNNELIFNKTSESGQSDCYDLQKPTGQNKMDCGKIR